jgi:SAM-dependent methyltransferase
MNRDKLRSLVHRFTGPAPAAPGSPAPAVPSDALAQAQARIEQLTALAQASAQQAQQLGSELLKNQIRVQWRIVDEIYRAQPSRPVLTCEICGHEGSAARFKEMHSHCMFGGGRLHRHQCPQCDTIFGPAKMLALSPEELSQEYEMHYRLYPEGDSTAAEIRAFHALQPTREGRYLNYGSGGWSRSVSQLRTEGWNVLAFEPHQAAAQGEHEITSQTQLDTMRFDGIFSNNVLEHFRHPVEALDRMAQLLEPGGRMSHATPCFKYLYEFTRFHLFFFPGRSLEALAKAAGLRVNEYTEDGDFMNAVLSRPSSNQPAVQ